MTPFNPPLPSSAEIAKEVRSLIVKTAGRKRASHVGGALSCTDILCVLYRDILQHDPENPKWEQRDRLYYSKGHACLGLYSTLLQFGYFDTTAFDTFTDNGSYFTSHVNHHIPGVELSTGSLGHALNVASGVSLAGKLRNANWRTFVILSDGELNEGSNWEAILFAPHHHLDMTVVIDFNKIQSFGHITDVLNLESLCDKFKAFNWRVKEIDGHNYKEIQVALGDRRSGPLAIIANTIKGKGVSFMEDQLAWHYKSPTPLQVEQALKEIQSP